MENEMEYLFVFDPESRGWWLKIENEEQLLDYVQKTNRGWSTEGLELYWKLYKEANELETRKERGKKRTVKEFLDEMPMERRFKMMTENPQAFNAMFGAIIQAEKYGGSIIDGFRNLNLETGLAYLDTIRRDGQVYINPVGGKTFYIDYEQFCRKKELSFPSFTEKDIRIKKFDGGTHYYAYVGNVEVRDGDRKKFSTREEAYRKAMELIG